MNGQIGTSPNNQNKDC